MPTDPDGTYRETNNTDRASWALLGLQTYRNATAFNNSDRDLTNRESFEEAVSDMLCDLMHLATTTDFDQSDFAEPLEAAPEALERLLQRGRSHFDEEIAEAQLHSASTVCGHPECVVALPCKREAPDFWRRATGR